MISDPTVPDTSRAVAANAHIARLTAKSIRTRNMVAIMDKLREGIMDEETRPADRSSLARSYCQCEDSLRVLRGESKPANLSISQSMQLSKSKRPGRIVDVESVVRSLQATQATEGPTLPE